MFRFTNMCSVLVLTLTLSACNEASSSGLKQDEVVSSTAQAVQKQTESVSKLKKHELAKKQRLLFFLNPNGKPCQIQKDILAAMGSALTEKVELKFISTTEMTKNRRLFQHYGIRALPSLILVNSKGEELHRMTPGIHSAEAINSVLEGM